LPNFRKIFLQIIICQLSEEIIGIINSPPRYLNFTLISLFFFIFMQWLSLINSFVPFNPELRFSWNIIQHSHVCILSLFKPDKSIWSLLSCLRIFWYFATSYRTILFWEIVFELLLTHILWNAFHAHITIFNWVIWFAVVFRFHGVKNCIRILR